MPLSDKVQANKHTAVPTYKRQLRNLIEDE